MDSHSGEEDHTQLCECVDRVRVERRTTHNLMNEWRGGRHTMFSKSYEDAVVK